MSPWQEASKSTSERLRKLYDKKLFSDIELLSKDGTKFRCHKLVLIMTSHVWENIIKQDDNIISIHTDLDEKTLTLILRYSYLDECQFETIFDSLSTCQAANKYGLKDLRDKSVKYAISYLGPDNVCQVYETVLDLQVPELNEKLVNVFLEDKSLILEFLPKCDSKEMVFKLCKLISNQVEPGRLFDSLQQWALNQCFRFKGSTIGDHLTSILPLEQFLKMTDSEFCGKVAKTGILTDAEVKAIVSRINAINIDTAGTPLPKWRDSNEFKRGLKSEPHGIMIPEDLIPTEFEVDLRHEIYEDGSTIESLECCFLTRKKGLKVLGLKFTTWILPEVWRESDMEDPSRLSLIGDLIVENEGLGRTFKNRIECQLSGNCTDEVRLDLDKPVTMIPGKRIKIKFIPIIRANSGRAFCRGRYEKCLRVAPKNSKSDYVLEFSDYENVFSRVKTQGLVDTLIMKRDLQWGDIGLKSLNPN